MYIRRIGGSRKVLCDPVCLDLQKSTIMRALILATITVLVTFTDAIAGGAHGGIVLSGPSGVVTNHGAIGPAALGLGGPGAGGYGGAYVGGPAGPSAYVGGPLGHSAYVGGPLGPSASIAGPALSHSSIVGPAAFAGHGFGLGLGFGALGGLAGFGGYGGYRSGLGLAPGVAVTNGGGTVGIGHNGVMVKGPPTVPATISGPSGKVVANGFYGLPTHGHGW